MFALISARPSGDAYELIAAGVAPAGEPATPTVVCVGVGLCMGLRSLSREAVSDPRSSGALQGTGLGPSDPVYAALKWPEC